ncbi:MAG: DUF4091 domain-containing protein [Kiritimatiellae bacterium]|nr:DUF4091 domain-containing protein [Kiritimatiellia bacterium]
MKNLALFAALLAGCTSADRTEPGQCEYYLDLWQHPWAVARYFNVEPFSAGHYAKMEPVWKTLAGAGVNVLTTTLVDLPWNHQCYDGYHSMVKRTRKNDGTWEFDYSLFDEYVAFGKKCGIGPDIACYTMCPWSYIVDWVDEDGNTVKGSAVPGTAEFEDYWGAFLTDFSAHLKAKGWFDHTYIAMDERSPEDVAVIARFVQEKAPGMKISMAGNRMPSDFAGITIDSYSQILNFVTPEFLEEAKERRAKGYVTTYYVCCWPERPNTFTTSDINEAFYVGVYPALVGLDGFLRWAANSWPEDPYKDASYGNWAPGDTFLVMPNGEMSDRMAMLCEGIEAAKKLRKLGREGKIDLGQIALKYSGDKAIAGEIDFAQFRDFIEDLVR